MILGPNTSPPQVQTPPVEATSISTIVKPATLRPPKQFQVYDENAATPPVELLATTVLPMAKPATLQPQKQFQVYDESAAQERPESRGLLEELKVPTIVLEHPSISHTMAATLSLSLLGHILFLKNQVPFPVAQLSRMPCGKSNPKVAKKRDELLASFDTLASHLQTTFVSLSTAYACGKSANAHSQISASPTDENVHRVSRQPHVASENGGGRATVHLMFVLGASVGTARARTLLTIDGLEVKVWGAREDGPTAEEDNDSASQSEEESSEEEDCDGDSESDAGSEDNSDDESECSDAEGSANEEEEGTDVASDSEESRPPPSRSPSPESPPSRSLAPSPESLPSPAALPTPLPAAPAFTVFRPPPGSATSSENLTPAPRAVLAPLNPQHRTPLSASRAVNPLSTSSLSYAEEQQALRAAERLLSRTLMNAWVDGQGDMSSELAPTQTHVYLRAPRRFAHPAWAARQNLNRALDGVLDGFLQDAGAVPARTKKPKSKGVRTEGAWIGCRGGSAFVGSAHGKTAVADRDEIGEEVGEEEENEDDEEIWWAWEGKFVGFADW